MFINRTMCPNLLYLYNNKIFYLYNKNQALIIAVYRCNLKLVSCLKKSWCIN